jgi:hypothetical protein
MRDIFRLPTVAVVLGLTAVEAVSYEKVQEGVECKSADTNLVDRDTVDACAEACFSKASCRFFIFGTGAKAGRCWQEHTTGASCPVSIPRPCRAAARPPCRAFSCRRLLPYHARPAACNLPWGAQHVSPSADAPCCGAGGICRK